MQDTVGDGDVDALAAAGLARLPRQIVLGVMPDRMSAQHDVAEERSADLARRRHDPSHAELRSELLGVPGRVRARPDHFLQRDYVGLDPADDLRDSRRDGATVETATAVNVVRGDAQRARAAVAVIDDHRSQYVSV